MVNSTTLIPATTPAFGMSACGHLCVDGGTSARPAAAAVVIPAAAALRVLLTQHQGRNVVAEFAGKRGYMTRWGSSSWRPSHC